jgi:hypothetical protein
MKPKVLLRIAVFCILFFIVGHSIGHFTRKEVTDQKGLSVLRAMEDYKFPIGTQFRSYDEFYTGMSLNLILSLVSIGFLLWMISNVSISTPRIASRLLWPILFVMVGFTITGFLFFFVVPAVTCLLASALILTSILLLQKT